MRCYSHLSDDEREQIGLAKALGHSSRNKLPSGRYSPLHAAGAYQLRRRREALIERDRALRTFVVDRLAEGWTPEQISGWLKGGNERRPRPSQDTIKNCVSIHERPKTVDGRTEGGHWEGDLIICKRTRPVLGEGAGAKSVGY